MIMSYRAKSLKGPWQEDPANPVMHAPHTTNAKLQGPGHGEVFQAHNGQWYLTYHAYELSHYSLGRQMCLEPVTWTDDGWWRPVNGRIPSEQNQAPKLKQVAYQMQDSDEFDSAVPGKQWFFHTEPDYSGSIWSLTEKPGNLRIKTSEGDQVMPLTEIIVDSDFFDYKQKYSDNGATEITPADIEIEKAQECQAIVKKVFNILRLKRVARIDFILKENKFYLIEVNTIPGMSAKSILPQQAKHEGMGFSDLIGKLV
jgi:hypothetical protein